MTMASSCSALCAGFAPKSLALSFVNSPSKLNLFGFQDHHSPNQKFCTPTYSSRCEKSDFRGYTHLIDRRKVLILSIGILVRPYSDASNSRDRISSASEYADMPALRGKDYGKTKMRYPDYTETESGLQYKDLRVGNGPSPKTGETVVVDWDGYTIGYYGRIFEARNKTKGGSFEGGEKDFFKFKIGYQELLWERYPNKSYKGEKIESQITGSIFKFEKYPRKNHSNVIPAFEEAVTGMALGGVRRIIVPPELGYPDNDFNRRGPSPTTFSGQRALDFVLKNQGMIDKTLLFDIELLKIIPN